MERPRTGRERKAGTKLFAHGNLFLSIKHTRLLLLDHTRRKVLQRLREIDPQVEAGAGTRSRNDEDHNAPFDGQGPRGRRKGRSPINRSDNDGLRKKKENIGRACLSRNGEWGQIYAHPRSPPPPPSRRRMHKYDYAHIRTRYFFLHFGETEERVNDRRCTAAPHRRGSHFNRPPRARSLLLPNTFITVPLFIRRHCSR